MDHVGQGGDPEGMGVEAGDERQFPAAGGAEGIAAANADLFQRFQAVRYEGGTYHHEIPDSRLGQFF